MNKILLMQLIRVIINVLINSPGFISNYARNLKNILFNIIFVSLLACLGLCSWWSMINKNNLEKFDKNLT